MHAIPVINNYDAQRRLDEEHDGGPVSAIPIGVVSIASNSNNDAAIWPHCRMSRNSLHDVLKESRSGEDEALFNTYFIKGSTPLRCACGRLVVEHAARDEQKAQAGGGAAAAAPVAPVTPEGLVKCDANDADPNTRGKDFFYFRSGLSCFLFGLGILLACVGVALFIAFGSVGILFFRDGTIVPATFVPAVILLPLGTVLFLLSSRVSITFDRVNREIVCEDSCLMSCCCVSRTVIGFASVRRIELAPTGPGAQKRDGVDYTNMNAVELKAHASGAWELSLVYAESGIEKKLNLDQFGGNAFDINRSYWIVETVLGWKQFFNADLLIALA